MDSDPPPSDPEDRYQRVQHDKRDKEGLWQGFKVKSGEGDIDWPAVRKALKDIGYSGWGAAAVPGGDRSRLREISQRMDWILVD